ncbi:MAG TPA: LysR substrate-binding domain-containing protein [Propionibacteriaceae bacterium]
MSSAPATQRPRLRVGNVPGVTVTKWRTIWADRFPRVRLEVLDVDQDHQRQVLTDGEVDLCFVRLPVDDDGLHLIRLYDELPVAWVSKDHLVAAVDEVSLADLADDTVLTVVTAHTIDLAAVGEAVLHVPQSIARSQSRRDFVYRPITDAPHTTIGLAWLMDNPNELIEEFIGIVRGRTANSSRTAQARAGKGQTKG